MEVQRMHYTRLPDAFWALERLTALSAAGKPISELGPAAWSHRVADFGLLGHARQRYDERVPSTRGITVTTGSRSTSTGDEVLVKRT